MAPMRRLLPIFLLALTLSACGGSTHAKTVAFAGASNRTVAKKTASFTLSIGAVIGGRSLQSSERGTVSFTDRRARFYKLVPGGGLPQEIVLNGPFAYTNANVDAAMNDPTVKPWTKLDTRRIPPTERKRQPDELAHVRVVAYLAGGVAGAKLIGVDTIQGQRRTHFRGLVDPAEVVAKAPAADRSAFRTAVRNDYLATPFPADFWLDDAGRVRRVRVEYRTTGGSRIVVDAGFSNFGGKIDLSVPPAADVQDITPK
jgi:hypothetical protein